jgi:branched-chain amino acid transport system substrate-binding protein
VAAVIAAVSGCGGADPNAVGASEASALTIYSSLPLQGPDAAISASIVNGEKLALAQAGGHVGRLHVSLVSLDDADPSSGAWNPAVTSTAARTASQDKSAIAYIGDYDSGATAISLPLINEAGILQISPGSPYVGLTSALDAGKGEPARYYPTGTQTFVRLAPDDAVQARAQVAYMHQAGVHNLLVLGDSDVFSSDIAAIVAHEAPAQQINVVGDLVVDRTADPASIVAKIRSTGADAVLFAGDPSTTAISIWRAAAAADQSLKLFAPSQLATSTFLQSLGAAEQRTYVTSPALPMRFYPAQARRFARDYGAQFHVPADAYALYGYEAVSATLAAIRNAGSHGTDRSAVRRAYFATQNRESVLGRYSVTSTGDTTLATFAADRVRNGRLVFDRLIDAGVSKAA